MKYTIYSSEDGHGKQIAYMVDEATGRQYRLLKTSAHNDMQDRHFVKLTVEGVEITKGSAPSYKE